VNIKVDFERCEGHGMCESVAPALFRLDEQGELALLFKGDAVPEGQEDQAVNAIKICPVGALRGGRDSVTETIRKVVETVSVDAPNETPVGVWSGTATHDEHVDRFIISFGSNGSVALTTPISSGAGTWSSESDGAFSYTVKEVFNEHAPLQGFVLMNIDARRSARRYAGSGPAYVRNPEGDLVAVTFAEVEATQTTDRLPDSGDFAG
jgi:ferredoxin